MTLHSKISFVVITTMLYALIYGHHNSAEAAMLRLVINGECSDAELSLMGQIVEGMRRYTEGIDRGNDRRQLRHAESKSKNTTESSKIEDIHLLLKGMEDPFKNPFTLNNTNVTYVHIPTGDVTGKASSSERDLWPLNCQDLCAGYVPRRCLVTRCIGYRRQRRLTAQDEPCIYSKILGDWLIDYYSNDGTFSSGCVATRSWQCILHC